MAAEVEEVVVQAHTLHPQHLPPHLRERAVRRRLRRGVTLGGEQRVAQRHLDVDRLLEVGGIIGQPCEQPGRGVQVVDGLSVGASSELVVGGDEVIAHGAVEIAAPGEVGGEDRGERCKLRQVAGLQARADPQVVAGGLGDANSPVDDVAVEVMIEGERGRDRAVRPGAFSTGMGEHASPGQVGEGRFDVLIRLLRGR